VNLLEILEHQIGILRGATLNADFELHAPRDRAIHARVDATLFRQVLGNLVRNGIEANPGRHVRFTITVEAGAAGPIVRVGNDGVPVPQDLAPRIFDPYISGKSGKDNMGLGLAIVKKIVLEHGGDVRYEERGGHPEFVISLPGRVL
jgi:two-component system, NtrC family, nitrogen regulation sensor histidine kinase NtrY